MQNLDENNLRDKAFLPYPISTLSAPIRLVDRAREIESADIIIRSLTESKLELIASQIRKLQEDARAILEQSALSAELHRIKCNFQKKPGEIYYLYIKPEGDRYFSLLSPEDWKGNPPHEYLGTYELGADGNFNSK